MLDTLYVNPHLKTFSFSVDSIVSTNKVSTSLGIFPNRGINCGIVLILPV